MLDRLRALEVLVAVADTGSLARAAARLGLSAPAVTRALAAQEDRVGARLFNRTTRSLTITEAGQRMVDSARRVIAELNAAESDAAGEATDPHGHLVVTAPVTFGRQVSPPITSGFLRQYARVTLSMVLLDRVTNLVEEGIDLAIRIGALPDSSQVARRVGAVRRVMVASPRYLADHGMPAEVGDLRDHHLIAFSGLTPAREWRLRDGHAVSVRPRLTVNDAATAIAAAEAGDGITAALSYMVADAVRAGRLCLVLDAFAPSPVPVSLVYPHARLAAPKLRAFVDFAAPRFADVLEALALPAAVVSAPPPPSPARPRRSPPTG